MRNMYVLCKVNGKDNAEYIEDKLIAICENDRHNINKISGGSGINGQYNYIYVLLP